MNNNLYAVLEKAFPECNATLLEDEDGTKFTYGQITTLSAQLANSLASAGAIPGDRIAAQVDKSPEALALYLACLRGGFVYLPLNTAYKPPEIAYFLGDATPTVFVCRPESFSELGPVAAAAGTTCVLTLGATSGGSLMELARIAPSSQDVYPAEPDELAIIIYTSGTTGRSKGAMLSHGNLATNGQALVQAWGFSGADVLLHQLPLFHVHGLFISTHCVLLSGSQMLFHRRFDAALAVSSLPRCTVMMGVPTFYTRLLAEPGFTAKSAMSIRLFVSGSAPLLLDTFREFESRIGQPILERYGMSEAGVIATNPLVGERRGGTVGKALPGMEIRIAGDNDRRLPAGETGGIQIRGESVFHGYWRKPEKTSEEFTEDRWFRTGDQGFFDADGYLSIAGRAKDLIISGGYNVYPKEIEAELDVAPGVLESAVIGVPHPDFGEAVVAVVVPVSGASVDGAELLAGLRDRLANYKIPKRIHLLPDLPRNAMGKVQKNLLRDQFAGTFSNG
jgi:malonyl-CoA/methylmalonyl-CoA synthetase